MWSGSKTGSRVLRLLALLLVGLSMAVACSEQPTSKVPPSPPVPYDPALPSLLKYGRDACPWCVKMQPILQDLSAGYRGKLNVNDVNVDEQPDLARRAGVDLLPTVIIYNPAGFEVARHVGFWPKEEIVAKLHDLGINR
ncbi:MAG: thioredoxin family protein [Pseudomonadota bacterium]